MAALNQIRWGRIFLGGLFIELTIFAIVLPLNVLSQRAAYYSVPVLVLATAYIFGRWAARPLEAQFVLHGALVAVTASLMYLALTTAMGVVGSLPLLFHVSNGIRILGGMAGGASAARQAKAAVPAVRGAQLSG
jgi:hypothetical protein